MLRSRVDSPSEFSELQKPLDIFRAKTKRLKIHPAEMALLWVVGAHLVFLPWAFGGMAAWTQVVSLVLGFVSLVMALVPRRYTEEHSGSNSFRLVMWPRATTASSNATTSDGRPSARINLHDNDRETAFAVFGFRSKDEVKVAT